MYRYYSRINDARSGQRAAIDVDIGRNVGAVKNYGAGIDVDLIDSGERGVVGEDAGTEREVDGIACTCADDIAVDLPPEMFSTSALAESLMSPAISPPVCVMVTGLVAKPTSIAVPPVPMMVPELTIVLPAVNVTPSPMRIPISPVIVPELLMLPAKVETLATDIP
jgi:hypothetical protein